MERDDNFSYIFIIVLLIIGMFVICHIPYNYSDSGIIIEKIFCPSYKKVSFSKMDCLEDPTIIIVKYIEVPEKFLFTLKRNNGFNNKTIEVTQENFQSYKLNDYFVPE